MVIVHNRAQCRRCGAVLESHHAHDYVRCPCGAIAIDGGRDYLRRIGEIADIIELSMVVGEPEARKEHMEMQRDEWVQRYGTLRAWFDELVAFAEVAREALPADSPLLARYDYDMWMGQLQVYQTVSCERCGTYLSADALGLGAYACESYARLCSLCYDDLTGDTLGRFRRLARLTAYAQEHPELIAGSLVLVQQQRGLDDEGFQGYLGVDSVGVLRLACLDRRSPAREADDLAVIAQVVKCDVDLLRRLLLITARPDPYTSSGNDEIL